MKKKIVPLIIFFLLILGGLYLFLFIMAKFWGVVVIILGIMGIIGSFVPKSPEEIEAMVDKSDVTIPISKYHEFFVELADSLKTKDIDLLYSKHRAMCSNCGVEFTKEALQSLDLFSPENPFSKALGGRMVVIGATKEGDDMRHGKCSNCGHSEMKIIVNK